MKWKWLLNPIQFFRLNVEWSQQQETLSSIRIWIKGVFKYMRIYSIGQFLFIYLFIYLISPNPGAISINMGPK